MLDISVDLITGREAALCSFYNAKFLRHCTCQWCCRLCLLSVNLSSEHNASRNTTYSKMKMLVLKTREIVANRDSNFPAKQPASQLADTAHAWLGRFWRPNHAYDRILSLLLPSPGNEFWRRGRAPAFPTLKLRDDLRTTLTAVIVLRHGPLRNNVTSCWTDRYRLGPCCAWLYWTMCTCRRCIQSISKKKSTKITL